MEFLRKEETNQLILMLLKKYNIYYNVTRKMKKYFMTYLKTIKLNQEKKQLNQINPQFPLILTVLI